MQQFKFALMCLMIILNLCLAENKWVWPDDKTNRRSNAFYSLEDKRAYRMKDDYARADRDREPTTKRPIPGQPQDDEIDDYPDVNDEPTQQDNPFVPKGGDPRFFGTFDGFGFFPKYPQYPQYPQYPTNTAGNGILIGPGGPTGIIGRPHAQYPLAGVAPSSTFPAGQGGYPNYGIPHNFAGSAINSNSGFHSYNGVAPYPGQVSTYPNTQQFAGVQYPQYTEGYGLAHINPGAHENPSFIGSPPLYGPFGFKRDEYAAQVEGKSANVKELKKVDDKVTKDLKTS